jgi:predicted AlkP superfamily phosphohydrolase/phosphomutase
MDGRPADLQTGMRSAQTALTCAAVASLAFLAGSCASNARATGKRIIVLGIDGMDPNFLERHWDSLPHLNQLRRDGEFKRLETTMPPQSPVAWSTFITGMDPGGHGIFDFVHRDPATLSPYSSMAQAAEGGRSISVGAYRLPLTAGKVTAFRKGKPFWQILSEQHVPVRIIRMPTDFPPVHCDGGFSVAGMGTPDLRGTFGMFTFFTDENSQKSRTVPGGEVVRVDLQNHAATLRLQGPDNSLRNDKAPTYVEIRAHVDPDEAVARFDLGDKQILLREGEWSDWIQARFPLIPGVKSAAGMFRLYAKKLHPTFQIYASPVNIDPSDPELPVTGPESHSRDLAKEVGLFYTQGMAQDTAAFRQGVFKREEYIQQSRHVSEDHLKLLRNAVGHFESGLLFFHFFGVDQDSHMLWGKYDQDLLETYKMVDNTIAWVRANAPDATLIVMSDHGFSNFDRSVHLNTWLMKEGFLTLDDPKNASNEELFAHVDWSRTQAYSVGLNGIYLNLQGREREGSVVPGNEADALLKKIAERLQQARDPDTGEPMVGGVTLTRSAFHGEMLQNAPDIIVGYMPRYRSSWQTALGAVPAAMVEPNREEWRADHCIDARFVPGVLIANRVSREPKPRLCDLTVSLMQEFNVGPGQGMIGHSIY